MFKLQEAPYFVTFKQSEGNFSADSASYGSNRQQSSENKAQHDSKNLLPILVGTIIVVCFVAIVMVAVMVGVVYLRKRSLEVNLEKDYLLPKHITIKNKSYSTTFV